MDEAEKELQEVLKKYKAVIGFEISFPIYKQIPDEVTLALRIVKKHGMTISFVLKPQQ